MSKKTTKNPSTLDKLLMELDIAQTNVAKVHEALNTFNALPENNVYPTIKDALSDIETNLLVKSKKDISGFGSGGNDTVTQVYLPIENYNPLDFGNRAEYAQAFMVDDISYTVFLIIQYGHHYHDNKTYYHIDNSAITFNLKRNQND